MASALNRDVSVTEKDGGPDLSGKLSLGSTFDVNESILVGIQLSGAYDTQWRERTTNTSIQSSYGTVRDTGGIYVFGESNRHSNGRGASFQ